jgi:hypothetical protein
MPTYEVIGGAASLRVQGDNWLSALGASLEYFGLDSGAVARLAINVRPNGEIDVSDPVSGRSFKLAPADEMQAASVKLNDMDKPAVLEMDEPTAEAAPEAAPAAPPPSLVMPGQSLVDNSAPPPPPPAPVAPPAPKLAPPPPPALQTVAPSIAPPAPVEPPAPVAPVEAAPVEKAPAPVAAEPPPAYRPSLPQQAAQLEDDRPEDLVEQLFDLTFDIAMAGDVGEACNLSLEILRKLVPADAGAVLYGDINAVGLTFMAAYGPAATGLQGKTISFETGVAGFCHQHGVGLVLNDTVTDERHDKSVDKAVGYTTQAILAAPILSPGGHTFGCVELLNPRNGQFRDWHMEAAQTIAGSLADFVSRREGT